MSTLTALGWYDAQGNYKPYATGPEKVHQLGNSLRDSDGFVIAVKDDYGDWVNPRMKALGIKSRIKVEEAK